MQKWEYVVVEEKSVLSGSSPGRSYVPAFAVNGEVVEPRTTNIQQLANSLGFQGWELVMAYPIHAGKSANFIFKRAKI